ncbi:Carbon-nitrogen hydrolase [Modicella reniformis]|uniref:Carbon-nitrogen hydrolase n=1 Tax=Modicella reniformis TaxID=1440133 RepID=A0A9P6M1W0_9FUNG|nr:Carbon-nitrogen hydrolase [Modicella reniformis]
MKIACLQHEPILGEVQRNIDHVTNMVASLKPGDVDVLVLPEMAFTGYGFTSKDHIRPYLEVVEEGPSVKWAKAQAVRLNAHVQVGYPEKRIINEDGQVQEVYYNSLCFVSPEGRLLANYSKHFLYYTDENWAEEGPAFKSIAVEELGQVGFGICMDVNPYQFKAPFTDFEFATFHLSQKSNLVLCSMAWKAGERTKAFKQSVGVMNGGDHGGKDDDLEDEDELESALELQCDTIQYWAVRMNPFYTRNPQPSQEAILVIANRIGVEPGQFA